MRRSRSRPLAVLALVVIGTGFSRRAEAQGEEAIPLARGTLRLSLAPDWSQWDRRFGVGTPGLPAGSREPLAVDFSADSITSARLPFLIDGETRVRTLTGIAGYGYNLGRARLTLNASWRSIPLGFELAVSRRLVIGAAVPLVRARMEATLRGPDTSAATRGNVGLNPALQSPAAFDTYRSEVDNALAELLNQANNGPAALRAQALATLQAIQPLLCGLYLLGAGNAASQQSLCYDPAGAVLSPVLPVASTAAGTSLGSRLAQARTDYDQMRTLYAGQGVTLPVFTAPFDLPAAEMDTAAFRRLVLAPGGPLAGDSLTTIVRTRIGDVETGAWYQLADRPRWRSQLSLLVRLPTGSVDSPDNFIDLGTGDGQLDVEVGMRNDLVLSPQLWIHVGGRYGRQFAQELDRRVAPADVFFPLATSRARISRDPGDYVALDVTPHWQLDDSFGLGIGYHFYRLGAARHSYVDATDEARIGLPASVLDEETAMTRMRIGAGITFSTLARHARGTARLPYTVTAAFQKTFYGGSGNVPDVEAFTLRIRAYVKL